MIALCCQYYKDRTCFDESLKCLENYKIRNDIYTIDGREIGIYTAKSTNAFMGRNALVYGAVKVDKHYPPILPFSEWWFFDSDIKWDLSHIRGMLNDENDIFMYPYKLRGEFKYNVAKLENGLYVHYPMSEKGFKEVDGGGAGALKITRKVVETIPPFLFFPQVVEVNGQIEQLPEDYSFCIKAKKYRFNIHCDFGNPAEHIENKGINMADEKQQQQVSAYQRATATLKRMTKDAMIVDDIVTMYQEALVDREAKIKELTDELGTLKEASQPGEA